MFSSHTGYNPKDKQNSQLKLLLHNIQCLTLHEESKTLPLSGSVLSDIYPSSPSGACLLYNYVVPTGLFLASCLGGSVFLILLYGHPETDAVNWAS